MDEGGGRPAASRCGDDRESVRSGDHHCRRTRTRCLVARAFESSRAAAPFDRRAQATHRTPHHAFAPWRSGGAAWRGSAGGSRRPVTAFWIHVWRSKAQQFRPDHGTPAQAGGGGMSEPLLRLENITKNFGAIEALRGVSFDIARGEVVALLGDNGAGKSTLVKIIAGGLEATSGRMLFDGEERKFYSPAEAKAAGIETVYQDLSLCTNVDVVANFF